MNRHRKLSRRSFFSAVTGGGLLVGGGVSFGLSTGAPAQQPEKAQDGVTRAPGRPEGTQVHDTDKGASSDNTNIGGARGIGRVRVRLCSDSDGGPGADPLGESRTKRTYADPDRGPRADPVRQCPRPWYGL